MVTKKTLIILTFSIIVWTMIFQTTTVLGSEGERKVNLRGTWRFMLGDNMKFASPDYNDKEWEDIYVPAAWQQEGFRNYNGYAWYRTTFTIEFKANEPLYVELGRIDDADEVYVNGHLIGSNGGFPPDYYTAFNVPRIYALPTEYLSATKKNVIAVRVYDEGGMGGIIGRDVGIYSYSSKYAMGFTLAGTWKFHLFDDKEWAREEFDDSAWENIAVPSNWENQGFKEYDGFAWYRKKFVLPADFKTSDMVILLGRIDDMDEVFINGQRIGGTGRIEHKWADNDEYRKQRTYFIPDGLLHAGKTNVVAVRVYDQVGAGGIYEGPVTIIPGNSYKEFWRQYERSGNDYFWWWPWDRD